MHFVYKRWAKLALLVWALFALLWAIGLLDYLFLPGLDQFDWPMTGHTIRQQVRLQLSGHSPEFAPLNNWTEFRPLIGPSCAPKYLPCPSSPDKFVLIVVRSAPDRVERRQAVRATWGVNAKVDGWTMRTVFVVGSRLATDSNFLTGKNLAEEINAHGDLIVGNFVDHYYNCTRKTLQAIWLARHHCGGPPVPFMLMLDDDMLFFPWNLPSEMADRRPDQHLYMGTACFRCRPIRVVFNKWRTPLAMYPYAFYPPYIRGNAVLLSRKTLEHFYAAIPFTKLYRFDDIFLGILAHLLHIEVLDNTKFPSDLRFEENGQMSQNVLTMHGFSADQILRIGRAEKERRRNMGMGRH